MEDDKELEEILSTMASEIDSKQSVQDMVQVFGKESPEATAERLKVARNLLMGALEGRGVDRQDSRDSATTTTPRYEDPPPSPPQPPPSASSGRQEPGPSSHSQPLRPREELPTAEASEVRPRPPSPPLGSGAAERSRHRSAPLPWKTEASPSASPPPKSPKLPPAQAKGDVKLEPGRLPPKTDAGALPPSTSTASLGRPRGKVKYEEPKQSSSGKSSPQSRSESRNKPGSKSKHKYGPKTRPKYSEADSSADSDLEELAAMASRRALLVPCEVALKPEEDLSKTFTPQAIAREVQAIFGAAGERRRPLSAEAPGALRKASFAEAKRASLAPLRLLTDADAMRIALNDDVFTTGTPTPEKERRPAFPVGGRGRAGPSAHEGKPEDSEPSHSILSSASTKPLVRNENRRRSAPAKDASTDPVRTARKPRALSKKSTGPSTSPSVKASSSRECGAPGGVKLEPEPGTSRQEVRASSSLREAAESAGGAGGSAKARHVSAERLAQLKAKIHSLSSPHIYR